MANELILAVDDEAHILELLSFNLEASGYRVVTAATGEDALVVCAHERPAMVLLDIMLPGIDGMEVCRRLKSAPTTADIPIIMLTAKGDEVDKILGLELGADDYITKPFSVRELIARVKALLRRAPPAGSGSGLIKKGDKSETCQQRLPGPEYLPLFPVGFRAVPDVGHARRAGGQYRRRPVPGGRSPGRHGNRHAGDVPVYVAGDALRQRRIDPGFPRARARGYGPGAQYLFRGRPL